jgi:hypothetical protein
MVRALLPAFVALAATCLLACSGNTIGDACTKDSECHSGETCLTNEPGGFCGKTCSEEGSTSECPGSSICTNQSGPLICAPKCTSQSDCRVGYECVGVGNVSNTKACRPK